MVCCLRFIVGVVTRRTLPVTKKCPFLFFLVLADSQKTYILVGSLKGEKIVEMVETIHRFVRYCDVKCHVSGVRCHVWAGDVCTAVLTFEVVSGRGGSCSGSMRCKGFRQLLRTGFGEKGEEGTGVTVAEEVL